MSESLFARFESVLPVRPDDIDMFNHVHSSRYVDYLLAARYDQMARCYGLSWEAFAERGFGWVYASTQFNFKRPLGLGDRVIVRTWIEAFREDGVRVGFEMDREATKKRSCDGWAEFTMVALATGRAAKIPDDIREKYSLPLAPKVG